MDDQASIKAILDFWFGELDRAGLCHQSQSQLWFTSSDEIDQAIREQFKPTVKLALAGNLNHWTELPNGALALVLLLDQFTRNIYRGTPQAFAGDDIALSTAKQIVSKGNDTTMPTIHRVFLYLPFEHSENLDDQIAGVAHFDRLLEDCPNGAAAEVEGFAATCVPTWMS